ncbi:hypothetical protein P4H65_24795 [Paenibacillus chitinolyticus]|uniref:hypothetical protein n=1 Tax=Paenibacillus chitinolyticus TaxID=79263 RepID=UPI002DB7C4EB|nr:hypothetical protein [Paenibacillus chitinolyticus]MEC0249013.1 hypothetical protein [Paenibacillus chitinolyticus]
MTNELMPRYAYAGEPYWGLTAVTADRQPHPVLVEARQTAPNQILMTYDQRSDLASATNVSNYWIRSNMGPADIASAGMSEALTAANAIRPDMAMITPADNSRMRFLLTFRVNAMRGVMYTVLPCFVNLEGMTGFRGENWGPFSRNMFIGM